MIYSISEIIYLFLFYSFVGWLWETIYCSILDKRFTYRGFLVGPYCPVYGFAVTTVLLCTTPFQKSWLMLFLSGMLIATAFEYLAGWFLETFFHMKLWDYSHEFGNIKGRIAPKISLFWGFGILILVNFIHPHVMDLLLRIDEKWSLLVVLVMGADCAWTVTDTAKFHQAALAFEKQIHREQEKFQASLHQQFDDLNHQAEFLNQHFEELKDNLLDFVKERKIKPFKFNQRRLLKNYSKFRAADAPLVTEMHKQIALIKGKITKKD